MTRQELVQNAVEFLSSREAGSSSLTSKIEFLQQKGLDDGEIQEALAKSQNGVIAAGAGTGPAPALAPGSAMDFYHGPPTIPYRGWKDILAMTTATVGLGYGLYAVMKNYIIPYVIPPEKSELEKDKEEISREFSRVENFLKEYDARQTEFLRKQEERSSKIDDTLNDIGEIIAKTNEKNEQNEQSLKNLKMELEGLKNTMVSNLNGVRTSVIDELTKIEHEVERLAGDSKRAGFDKEGKEQGEEEREKNEKPNEETQKNNDVSSKLRKVPPTTSVPSANDILKGKDDDGIPAWQKARKTDSIPEWQLRS